MNPVGPTVGPPLFAIAASRALTFDWLFAPVIVAPVVLPIRLKFAVTAPATSSITAPVPLKFPSEIVFCNVRTPAPASLRMPPPLPVLVLSESARLFVIVVLISVIVGSMVI